MSPIPIDALIRRLAGSEGPEQEPLSPAQERAVRLAVHGGAEAAGARSRAGRDAAAEHLRLAAYLDGTMTAQEKAAFEEELARSPFGREQLISAAAWLDDIGAKRQSAPDHLVQQALALDAADSRQTAEPWWQWLAPRRRWVLAAGALASVAIVLVAIQAARQVTSSGPSFKPPEIAGADRPAETRPAALKRKVDASPELVSAILAYDRNPGTEQRKELLARLMGPSTLGIDLDRIQTIEIDKALRDRLQAGAPPATISLAAPAADRLVLGLAD
jgi:hypothetical protein